MFLHGNINFVQVYLKHFHLFSVSLIWRFGCFSEQQWLERACTSAQDCGWLSAEIIAMFGTATSSSFYLVAMAMAE